MSDKYDKMAENILQEFEDIKELQRPVTRKTKEVIVSNHLRQLVADTREEDAKIAGEMTKVEAVARIGSDPVLQNEGELLNESVMREAIYRRIREQK